MAADRDAIAGYLVVTGTLGGGRCVRVRYLRARMAAARPEEGPARRPQRT
ncbi:hypothetical protein [Streptomyces sp. NPDC059080]